MHFFGGAMGVFTTQALLQSVGAFGNSSTHGAVAINWILKDGAGRVGKMLFARPGKKFDYDLKQLRFAGDLLMEFGACVELAISIMPNLFLPLACAANVAKNVGAMTSTSTRTPIYKAFAKRKNIGDVTAKGECVGNIADLECFKNTRGVQLFTCQWLPISSPKALVFLCHGYGMECSEFMRGVGSRLAADGYGVFGMDYEGHGKSSGSRCYIKRFDNIVHDCTRFFKSVCCRDEYREKKRFLYGESMGGAVALLVHKKDPSYWHGAVLVAPMCKISEKVKPHPIVISMLTKVEDVIPRWKIVPTKDVIDSAFKDPIKREEVRSNKLIYQEKPRLKTALEMLRTSLNLENSLNEVTLPFFVLHGEADIVTDPEISKALYEQASSKDKTIKLYKGMWHALTAGEPDDNIEIVFNDIISWLDTRITTDDHQETDPISSHVVHDKFDMITAVPASGFDEGVKSEKPRRKTGRVQGSYLCGWKGRHMHHHSAM